ncbi:MAG: leucine-rich repeat protein, partial [Prolixibacteraceae bacterium]|nr:leucine-rich repeat protein [Prolixibacteraceae bacterium]
FNKCTALESIDIPGSVSVIGSNAFAECYSLSNVTLLDFQSLVRIANGAFRDCIALKVIYIPETVNYLGSSVFEGCKSLNAIDIHEYITFIGDYIFAGCENLVSVDLSESLKRIPKYAFYQCSSLSNITIPNLVTIIDEAAFMDCKNLVSVQLPIYLDTIGKYVFNGCTNLTNGFDIPQEIKYIGEKSFMNCHSLNGTITIPESVNYIGNAAFAFCSKLEHVINHSTDTLRSQVFYLCSNLESVMIPQGVKAIQSYAFAFCRSLISVEIPESVAVIGEMAFTECSNLESVVFNDGIEEIDSYAFSGCAKLGSLGLPPSVIRIGPFAFNACLSMVNATFEDGIEEIGTSAFAECIGLTKVVLPSTLKNIGSEAFYNCQALRRIYAYSQTPIGLYDSDYVFQYVNKSDCLLFVPKGAVSSYKNDYQWSDFFRILEIGDIYLSSSSVKINAAEGSSRMMNLKGDASWEIVVDTDWLNIDPIKGQGDASITFTAKENPVIESRSALVTVTTDAGYVHQVVFTQDAGAPKLTTNVSELWMSFEQGSSQTIQIESNTEWEALVVEEWLSIEPTKGKGNGTINITANENITDTARVAYVNIFSEGIDTVSVLVTQMADQGTQPYLEVSINEVTFKADDNEVVSVSIDTNVDWTAASDQAWLKVEPTSGSGSSIIYLRADNNDQNNSREAIVSIVYDQNQKAEVKVIQEAINYNVNNEYATTSPKVYPNPFKEGIKVEGFSGLATIRIIGANGEVLIQKDIRGSFYLELDDLPKGFYHAILSNNDFWYAFKLAKK